MRSLCLLLLSLATLTMQAQIRLPGYRQADVDKRLFYNKWRAAWISLKGEPRNVYGVYHFRKTFELKTVPQRFIVHVSADNRYKLYCNGQRVSLGPARSDTWNWNFETIDLAPHLREGKNVLAAEVWNFADLRPAAQMTFGQTGFLLQGNTEAEDVVNTNTTWRALRNNAYQPWSGSRVVSTYFSGPGEKIDAKKYPWGWQQPDYDDSQWSATVYSLPGAMKDTRNYRGRMLVPRPIPPMESTPQRFSRVRESEGVKATDRFVRGEQPLTIPAHTRARIVLDQDSLTTGYLTLRYSGGEGARMTVGYTEAFYEANDSTKKRERMAKGNRNETRGKRFFGTEDIILPDGGTDRNYTTLWWRTWRYVELQVETADEPLLISDAHSELSAYPFKPAYTFSSPGHPELERMMQIGWRTARLCANETYMDCPYYEQLQYWGDTRIQALITMHNTRDTCLVRNALEQGRQSIGADGITRSRYPSDRRQFISSFSLLWVMMGHDYWTYRGDERYLRTLLPAWRGILSWYEQMLKADGSLERVPHWYFADWVKTFPNGGEPIRERGGNSAFQDLLLLMTLDATAEMERAFGLPAMADHYKELAARIRHNFRRHYWDERQQLFADTHDHRAFSQHVNALAILTDITTGDEAQQIMRRILAPDQEGLKPIARATIYFRYYVNRAMAHCGLGDELLNNLQPWTDQMALNLTTWAETPEPSRSDCHAWSASPNIELLRTLLGIDSSAPGFSRVSISPALGTLRQVSGSMPHPRGTIAVSYKVDRHGTLLATISLPEGIDGELSWKGKSYAFQGTGKAIVIKCDNNGN